MDTKKRIYYLMINKSFFAFLIRQLANRSPFLSNMVQSDLMPSGIECHKLNMLFRLSLRCN